MDREFWLQRWARGEIGFHQPRVNAYLQRYWDALGVPVGSRVLVPLCGKSHDMAWLRAKGYAVVGVEVSRQAVEQFFVENDLRVRYRHRPPFIHYYAGGIDLLVGDIFDLDTTFSGSIEAVYDRAALVALPPATRSRYVQHLTALLQPDSPVLLITFEYDQKEMHGPPFAVVESEIYDLYGGAFELTVLDTADVLASYPYLHERGLTKLMERVYCLVWRG